MPIARRQSQESPQHQSGMHRIGDFARRFEAELDVPLPSDATAVAPPATPAQPAGGRMLETSLFDDEDDKPLSLELELTATPAARANPQLETMAGPLPAMWAKSGSGLQRFDDVPKAVDPKIGLIAFAGYGMPPEKLSATPAYALRVWRRRFSLRSDLKIARMRRLPQRDIALYEDAIACADEGAITKGIVVMAGSVAGAVSAIAAVAALLF